MWAGKASDLSAHLCRLICTFSSCLKETLILDQSGCRQQIVKSGCTGLQDRYSVLWTQLSEATMSRTRPPFMRFEAFKMIINDWRHEVKSQSQHRQSWICIYFHPLIILPAPFLIDIWI